MKITFRCWLFFFLIMVSLKKGVTENLPFKIIKVVEEINSTSHNS